MKRELSEEYINHLEERIIQLEDEKGVLTGNIAGRIAHDLIMYGTAIVSCENKTLVLDDRPNLDGLIKDSFKPCASFKVGGFDPRNEIHEMMFKGFEVPETPFIEKKRHPKKKSRFTNHYGN